MPEIDLFLEKGFIPFFKEIKWSLWRKKDYISGKKKLIFQFTKKKFTAKEEKEILWIAYKLGLKHKSDFENKTPKLILPGRIETNSIYIEYY